MIFRKTLHIQAFCIWNVIIKDLYLRQVFNDYFQADFAITFHLHIAFYKRSMCLLTLSMPLRNPA